MEDVFKPNGALKSSKTDAGGGNTRPEPVIGVVKNNIDPTRSGRIQVYIQDIGANDPDNSENWITVSYLSPFFGMTTGAGPEAGYGDYLQNPSSYGMWYSAPDIGTEVVCVFINGDMNYGFYIGCVPKAEALQMVPAIGAVSNVIPNEGEAMSYGGAPRLPVTNINSNDTSKSEGIGFLTEPKPIHTYAAAIYNQQGLLRDPVRGPISSSASRESPSRVGWGVNTPGRPIYEGGFTDTDVASNLSGAKDNQLKVINRRSGHSIVMDDGDLVGKDQLIRLRSALGHQILMSDDGQCLHIIHANGQSWIELGKEGTIDMYATNSVNIRTQGDLNLHADNNININATKDLNVSAENIVMTSEKTTKFKAGTDINHYAIGKYTVKVNGAMSMLSSGEASYASSSITYINGSKINLNTGNAGLVPAEVPPIPVVAHTDTLYDATKGFAAAPGKLLSIVSRAPAHAPWANANQGVDVKTTLSASAALPAAPSSALASTNAQASATPVTNPVTVATAATVPDTGPVSTSLDKNATATMVGAVAKDAASTASSAIATGAGVVTDAAGKAQAVVGQLAQTPKQLESAGVLKPGSATLIDGLVQGGKTVTQAMTPNLFTGKQGAENLTAFATNTTAQVQAQVANFQQAQKSLTSMGVMTGKEAPGQIAGVVMAAATKGVNATVDFVKNAANGVTGAISGISNSVGQAISSGNFAANMSQSLTGGLSSISSALGGIGKSAAAGLSGLMDSAKGVAGSAFAAVTSVFKPMKAGVPQNLTQLAAKNAAEASQAVNGTGASLTGITNNISGAVSGLTGSLTSAASGLTGSLSGALSSVTSVANKLGSGITSAITSVTGSVNSVVASIGSGLSGIPGGSKTVSTVINNAPGAVNSVPGTAAVTSLIKNTSTAINNSISSATAAASTLVGSVASIGNSVTGAIGSATSLLNSNTGSLSGLTASAEGAIKGGIDGLKKSTDGLASMVTSGLPPGAASELNAAISSLSAGGPIPIKLPTVAVGTTDRSEISAQLGSLLGSKKIPVPNFDNQGTAAASDKLNKLLDQQGKLLAEANALDDQYFAAMKAYRDAKADLPQGDPAIEEARLAAIAISEKKIAILKQVSDLANLA